MKGMKGDALVWKLCTNKIYKNQEKVLLFKSKLQQA